MSYDHADNIGNEGDLVKHAVLVASIGSILDRFSSSTFVYVESHTGRAEYVLPNGGAWQNGIQSFSNRFHQLPQVEKEQVPLLKAYYETFVGNPVRVGQHYAGSSGIAFRLVKKHDVPYRFQLYETEAGAWVDLVRFYHPFPEVSVIRSDGFAGVSAARSASLVVIDPENLSHADEIIRILQHLSENDVPFICWTPRYTGSPVDQTESRVSENFYDDTLQYRRFRVRWNPWNFQGMRGCQLTISNEFGDLVAPLVEKVRNIMGWDED